VRMCFGGPGSTETLRFGCLDRTPMAKASADQFSDDETKRRFETALRGARIAGPRHVESVTPKKAKSQSKTEKAHKKKAR
jgi:hypothetical protein